MAFSYVLDSADPIEANVARVRLALGDTVEGTGILPSGANLSDLEIQVVLDENESDVTRAVGDLCAILARHWAVAADVQVGPRRESLSQVANQWREQAKAASTGAGYVSFAASAKRDDGYAANAQVDAI